MSAAGPGSQAPTQPSQSQQQAPEYHTHLFTSFLPKVTQLEDSLLKNTATFKDDLIAAGERISEFPDNEDKVRQLRGILESVVAMESEIAAHKDVVQHIPDTYEPSADTTQWKDVLDKRMRAHLLEHPCNPEASADLRRFDQDAGIARPGDGDDDDDLVCDDRSVNTCPLSQKPWMTLEDPVMDEKGIIYSYAALMTYFGTRVKVKCPKAGSMHELTRETLDRPRAERMVAKLKRKALIEGAQQQQPGSHEEAEEILDA